MNVGWHLARLKNLGFSLLLALVAALSSQPAGTTSLAGAQSELKCDTGTKPRATRRSIRTSSGAFHYVPKQVWSNRSLGLEGR